MLAQVSGMSLPRFTLTISIVSHGHGRLLTRLLDDLAKLPSVARAQIVITLNLPGEAFDPAPWPTLEIHVLRNSEPRGFGANHNAAFARYGATDWFAVLNPDLQLPIDPFPALVEAAGEGLRFGVLAPRIVDSSGGREDSVRANLTPWSLIRRYWGKARSRENAEWLPEQGAEHACFYWLAGMFMLFPSQAFRQVQGFDERFYLYCEDYDICARLWSAGLRPKVAGQPFAVHDAQRDSRRSLRYLVWHVNSLLKVWTSAAFWHVTLGKRDSMLE